MSILCALYNSEPLTMDENWQWEKLIVHKQPGIRKLSKQDVYCWSWDQGHLRMYYSSFFPRCTCTIANWKGWSTSQYHLRQTRWFLFHITNFPFLSSNIPSSLACCVIICQPIRYGIALHLNAVIWGPNDFPVSYPTRTISWKAWNCHSGSLMVDTVILFSNMKSLFHECYMTFWPLTSCSDFPTYQTFCWFHDLYTEFDHDLHRITSGFHESFATDEACQ